MSFEVILVNGIFNKGTIRDTKSDLEHRTGISNIKNAYNPSRLGAIFFSDECEWTGAKYAIENLSTKLTDCINKTNKQILIIAHSHGAYITAKTLYQLSRAYGSKIKNRVTVYTFGGICRIGNSNVKKVQNYRNRGDQTAINGTVYAQIEKIPYVRGWSSKVFGIIERADGRNKYGFPCKIIGTDQSGHSFNDYIDRAVTKIINFKQKRDSEKFKQKRDSESTCVRYAYLVITMLVVGILFYKVNNYV